MCVVIVRDCVNPGVTQVGRYLYPPKWEVGGARGGGAELFVASAIPEAVAMSLRKTTITFCNALFPPHVPLATKM